LRAPGVGFLVPIFGINHLNSLFDLPLTACI
jgi:hypothetical protein